MSAPSPLPAPPGRLESLRAALPESLSRALVSAAALRERAPRRELLPTAVPPLDALLRGGLPRGALVEVVAPRSTGRFSLGLAALAAATGAGEAAALVDLGDHLDPQAAAVSGVDLRRLLWVRPGPPSRMKQALAATETLLAAGFPLVVLDLGLRVPRGARQPAAWLRLARAALLFDAALLVLSPARLTGSVATAVLTARSSSAAWAGHCSAGGFFGASAPAAGGYFGAPRTPSTPSAASYTPLLEGLTVRLTLEKRAGERPGLSGAWSLRTTESLAVLSRGPSSEVAAPSRGTPSESPAPPRPRVSSSVSPSFVSAPRARAAARG